MRKSWSTSSSPGNSVYPSISSATIAHISIQQSQSPPPTNNSGGLYQRVATQSVRGIPLLLFACRANPKSQIFSWSCCPTKMLQGLISRWSSPRVCRCATSRSNWQGRSRTLFTGDPLGDCSMTYSKLCSRYQKTRYGLPFFLNASLNWIILGWHSPLSILTSLTAIFSPSSSWLSSLNFLMATISPVSAIRQRRTTPYALSPVTPRISYFCMMITINKKLHYSQLQVNTEHVAIMGVKAGTRPDQNR